MTIDEFKKLKNFSIEERDVYKRAITSDIAGIQKPLMLRIDRAVSFTKQVYGDKAGQFIVHDINLGIHSKKDGFHTRGMAIDGHFRGLDLYEQVMIGLKFGFKGVGFYLKWNVPGVHFDIRNQQRLSLWYVNEFYEYDHIKVIKVLSKCYNR